MAKLTLFQRTAIQAEIIRMSHGREKPLNELVAKQVALSFAAFGFESDGQFVEAIRLSPYSTLLRAVRGLMGEADDPAFPGEVANLIDEALALYEGAVEKPNVNDIIVSRLLLKTGGQNVASQFGYGDIEFSDGLRLRPFSTLLAMIVAASDRIT